MAAVGDGIEQGMGIKSALILNYLFQGQESQSQEICGRLSQFVISGWNFLKA